MCDSCDFQEIQIYSISAADTMVLGWLGRDIRVVLPSCAVKKIRDKFPSSSYADFKYSLLS